MMSSACVALLTKSKTKRDSATHRDMNASVRIPTAAKCFPLVERFHGDE